MYVLFPASYCILAGIRSNKAWEEDPSNYRPYRRQTGSVSLYNSNVVLGDDGEIRSRKPRVMLLEVLIRMNVF